MKPWHISTDRNTTMTSSRRNDADIDKRSTGCGSDVIRSLSQQITSRDRRRSWEIRYKNLPQVTATSPSFLSIIANVIKIECTLVGGEEFLGVDPRTQCQGQSSYIRYTCSNRSTSNWRWEYFRSELHPIPTTVAARVSMESRSPLRDSGSWPVLHR